MGCSGKACSWGRTRSATGCQTGTGDCAAALFVEAELSEFHDQRLADATVKIKEILEGLPKENSKGWKLSLLNTKMGTLLAYLDHDVTFDPLETKTTFASDEKDIISALGLKNYAASGASSS